MSKGLGVLVSICLLCALLFSACASAGDENTVDGELVAVKNESGSVSGYERRYHNDHGDVTRLDVYDAEQNYDHFVLYDYDDQYRLIQETTYRADGIGDFYYTYVYDDDGNLTEKGYYTMYDGATRTLYDTEGHETARYTYDSYDNLISYEVMNDGEWVASTVDTSEDTE